MNINEAKDFIKNSPISSVIGRYIPLNKRGQNYEGLCPFHQDSNPSMKVNDNKGLFKCFVCGVAGDHISFVERFKNIDFVLAVEDIAGHFGLSIEKHEKKQDPRVELALRVLQAAQRVYKKFATDSKISEFDDFLKQRKLDKQTANDFGMGFAPKNNLFVSYLETIDEKHRKDAINMALEIGLIRQSSNQGLYDTFRERIVFPIWDHSGQVRGFGSRATKDYQKAKYLNSQESFIFNKRDILYGFNIARSSIRQNDSVILTEGYMDSISLYQNGITQSVALMGVAIGQKPLKTIVNSCSKFFLGLDSDEAGFKAMVRINQDFMNEGILPYFLNFSPYKDPDEFIQNKGRLSFKELMDKAPTFLDIQIEKVIPEQIPELSEQKLEILDEVFSLLSPLGSHLKAMERIVSSAKRLKLQVSSQSIEEAYKDFLSKKSPTNRVKAEEPSLKTTPNSPQPPIITKKNSTLVHRKPEIDSLHRLITKYIIQYPQCLTHQNFTEILDFVLHDEVKRLINQINNLYLEIEETEYADILQKMILTQDFSLELKEVIGSVLFQFRPMKLDEGKTDKLMNDLLKKIKIERLKSERNFLRKKQIQSQTQIESSNYLEEIQKIEQQLSDLKRANRINS